MKAIAKAPEPHALTQYRLTLQAHYYGYAQKDELRLSLATEQRGICCYCMQRIRPGVGGMKIEHWRCQALYPHQQLDYENLLGACMGNEGQPKKAQHCDTRKGDATLSRNPANPAHQIESFIQYRGDGRIASHDAPFDCELHDILNLNAPFLINNRKAVLDGFTKGLPPGKTLSKATL
jgi:uncharacterized protein (TIGR02646 family)